VDEEPASDSGTVDSACDAVPHADNVIASSKRVESVFRICFFILFLQIVEYSIKSIAQVDF
jgi:hypothetical protein